MKSSQIRPSPTRFNVVKSRLYRVSGGAIQKCGARGYPKDALLEWIYRQARLADGVAEVRKSVINRFPRQADNEFRGWSCGRDSRQKP